MALACPLLKKECTNMTEKAGAWIFLLVLAHGLAGCNDGSNLPRGQFLPTSPSPPPPEVASFKVTAVQPKNGFIGSHVLLGGAGFAPGATVTIGGIAANILVLDSTFIRVLAPAGAGTVDVVVTNANGESATLAGGYTYEVVTLTVSPTTVEPGAQLSVSWVGPTRRSGEDWIGLFKVGDPNTGGLDWDRWRYTTGATDTVTFAAPAVPGDYEFRYMPDDGWVDVARSETVTVSASATETTAVRGESARDGRRRGSHNRSSVNQTP
jgi:hypothetical protein